MANYFTYFSLLIPLNDPAQQQYALELAVKAVSCRFQDGDEQAPAELPPGLLEVLEDWTFETEPDGDQGIWLHSDSGGIDAACAFIQHLLQKFKPQGRVEFQWSHDCSKPRVDAYGGGAAVITGEKILTMTTSQWLQQQGPTQSPE